MALSDWEGTTMNVFSERAGSPRFPSASFARVGEPLSDWENAPADSLDLVDLPPASHKIVEDHNGEPVCSCGWNPAQHAPQFRLRNRWDAVRALGLHALGRSWCGPKERWVFVRREGDVFLYARKVKGQYEPDWAELPVSEVGRPVAILEPCS